MYELRFTLDDRISHRWLETQHDLFTFLAEMNLLDEQYFAVYVHGHLFFKNWDETSTSCLFNGWTSSRTTSASPQKSRSDHPPGDIATSPTKETEMTEAERLRNALSQQDDEICQVLGKALGYPWFKDDQKNFPGATEANGVCVGDHVAESLAEEAADRIRGLAASYAEARSLLLDLCNIADSSFPRGEADCRWQRARRFLGIQ